MILSTGVLFTTDLSTLGGGSVGGVGFAGVGLVGVGFAGGVMYPAGIAGRIVHVRPLMIARIPSTSGIGAAGPQSRAALKYMVNCN